jgi:hypothetical protein
MTHNEGAMNLIKQDASNRLNFYNKVIPNLPHTLKDLLDKASSVENKLDANKNGANDAGGESSELKNSPNLNEKQKRDTRFFEFDNFRRVNNYIPKIHINKYKERDKDRILLPFSSPKDESYKGIMSLYDNNAQFCPTPNFKFNPMKLHESNEMPIKKVGEENSIQRNDIDYDYSLKPNFYTNRYIEYLYEDRGDKLYEENNVLKNLFDKNPNRDSKNELNFLNNNSPYLKKYNELLEKEKEEIEKENKEMYQNETIRVEEYTINSEEENNIKIFADNNNNNKDNNNKGNVSDILLDNYFEENLRKRGLQILDKNGTGSENEHDEVKEKKKYEPKDIFFEIYVQGEITKTIRNSSKKQHPRGMIIHGPIAEWYRLNADKEFTKKKGYFDIRKINFDAKEDLKNKIVSDNGTEEFVVKDVYENDKLNKKDTIFSSAKIEEFGMKTYRYFFQQLQNYFVKLLDNINEASYSVLKFLSDRDCTSLELNLERQRPLIEYIYWHRKLKILTIPSSFLSDLKTCMSSINWECQLITLTIKKSVSNSNDDPEDNLKIIFNNPRSITIQNIYFEDLTYSDKFLDALYNHIDTFYNNIAEDEMINNNIKYADLEKNKNLRLTKLPIINLSWKKTQNNENSSKSETPLNLKGLYYLLMYMLIKALKCNNGTLPEVFNKLDLSESMVSDDIIYLVKIITKFKIIKELDISNTKFSNNMNKVIDSPDFLSNIKLTKNYTETFDQQHFYDVTLNNILNDIQIMRDPEKKGNVIYDEDSSYNYSMGILPILEKIYIHNTDSRENKSQDIYNLFKRLKFFRGIYYSDQASKASQENNNQNYFCEELIEKINKDKKTYCENIFQISND